MDHLLQEISEKITAHESRLTYALEASEVGIWEWNLKTNKLIWDTQMLSIFDIKASEFQDNPDFFKKTIHADDVELVTNKIKKCLETGERLSCAYRVIHKDGNYYVISSKAKLVKDSTGKPERLIGVAYLESECPRFLFCDIRKLLPTHPELLNAKVRLT